MKARWWWMLGGVTLLTVVGGLAILVSFLSRPAEREWTTRSRAALEELEQGLDAAARGYVGEAEEHYARALELDPDFLAARLHLIAIQAPGSAEFKQLVRQLDGVDTSKMKPRERFLARYWRARGLGDGTGAAALVEGFLERSPNDLAALQLKCQALWKQEAWQEAEDCYYRLVEAHPNQVEAYDRLGFIDMAQGHFSEAEDYFRIHYYIAPEQAMPQAALGELLVLLGRYREAEELLSRAVEAEPDYCWGHAQLLRSYYFDQRFDEFDTAIEHFETLTSCDEYVKQSIICQARGTVGFLRGDFAEVWSLLEGGCLELRGGFDLIGHHVAVHDGRMAEARTMQQRLEQEIELIKLGRAKGTLDWLEPQQAHFLGVEAMAIGDYREASEAFRRADERLKYWTHQRAGFKLLNRLFLAHSLELEGHAAQALAMFEQVAAVNPHFADHLPELSFLEAR